jgi:hypothetical protein
MINTITLDAIRRGLFALVADVNQRPICPILKYRRVLWLGWHIETIQILLEEKLN